MGVGDFFVPACISSSFANVYPDFVQKRLRLCALHRGESEIRAQLGTIVLQEPTSSMLRCALVVIAAGALHDEKLVARSFREAFMPNSPAMLVKHISALWGLCAFLNVQAVPPLDVREELLYDNLNHMREAQGSRFDFKLLRCPRPSGSFTAW